MPSIAALTSLTMRQPYFIRKPTASVVAALVDGVVPARYRREVTAENIRDLEPEPFVIPLSRDGLEVVSLNVSVPGGWGAYFSDRIGHEKQLAVRFRVGPEDGPPAEISLGDDGRTQATYNRHDYVNVPFEIRELQISARPGSGGFASALLRDIPIVRIEAAINQAAARAAILPVILPAFTVATSTGRDDLTAYMLRPLAAHPPKPLDLKVEDPGGYRKPDSFYRSVAERYLWLAAVSSRPAQEFAEANGIPVGTVHRWVKEAKARRILLLPNHRGEKAS
jgi:hypothetical protein